MNKSQLLSDLANRVGVLSLIGGPVDSTPSGDQGTGLIWYQQPLWQVHGKAAVKQVVWFYVLNEGEAGEVAYYKDREPFLDNVEQTDLKAWMVGVVAANPNNYRGIQIHWTSESLGMVIYSVLVDDGAGGLKWTTYYVRKNNGSPKLISNHKPEFLNSIVRN